MNNASKTAADPWQQIRSRYQLEEKMGSGTFGVVYSATDIKTGKKVAIKLVTGI